MNTIGNDTVSRLDEMKREASLLSVVPPKLPEFVPFGTNYDIILQVVQSRRFFPVFITGETGNGKTLFVEQACANLGREYVRVNMTSETDEDDLLGGLRLKDGRTYVELGPVLIAALRGAVLLIDEIDVASPKIMCLQPLLEGKPITMKKMGIIIQPAPGFNVFATANTKGRGDEAGRYIGTGLMNEAFLERFPITLEQDYPKEQDELKILRETFKASGGVMSDTSDMFFGFLVKWSAAIRKSYAEGAFEDVMSTRRLAQIVKAYVMFGGDELAQGNALQLCINRFDNRSKAVMQDLYNKLVPDSSTHTNVGSKKKAKGPF